VTFPRSQKLNIFFWVYLYFFPEVIYPLRVRGFIKFVIFTERIWVINWLTS
jgi:hypothetical protein